MFIDSMAAEIRSLLETLDSLGVTAKHPKEMTTIAAHLDAYTRLEDLSSRATSFTAPMADGSDIEKRLTAGENVSDSEFIDYAARATAAGTPIGPAAQKIIHNAETSRVRGARDTLRAIFPAVIEDLRKVLAEAGDQPENSVITSLRAALSGIDKLAGRDACDYWCIPNVRTAKWAILERDAAEELEKANQAYAEEQRNKAEKLADEPLRADSAPRKPRNLRRQPLQSSGFGGPSFTASDLADYQASKSTPQPLTR